MIGPGRRARFELVLYGALVLFCAGLGYIEYSADSSLLAVDRQRAALTERYAYAVTLANDLRSQQLSEDALVLRFTLSGEAALYGEIEENRRQFLAWLRKLTDLDASAESRTELAHIHALKTSLQQTTEAALQARKGGASLAGTYAQLETTGKALHAQLLDALQALLDREAKLLDDARARTTRLVARLLRGLIAAGIVTAAGFVTIALLLVRLSRLRRLEEEQREQLHEATQRTAEARRVAVEAVSHDLQNPLSAIDLSLRVLQRQLASGKPFDPSAATGSALRSVASMRDLISALLDEAKLDAGTFQLSLAPGDLRSVIDRAAEVLAPLAADKGLTVRIAHAGVAPFPMDARRLGQVIANLLGNAIKFTPPGGLIEIRSRRDGAFVQVSISNTGPAIPADQLDKLFDRFWQASATRQKGTGLGLSIAKAVIAAHGGRIWATSSSPTTFHFTLPFA